MRDRVYFLVKDPHWAFVWWELTAASLDRREGQLTLRVHDVTEAGPAAGDAPVVCDVTIAGATDHWYLRLPASGRTYQVFLGFKFDDGGFRAAAVSNPASFPPEGPSGRWDESWSTVPMGTVSMRRLRWRNKAIS